MVEALRLESDGTISFSVGGMRANIEESDRDLIHGYRWYLHRGKRTWYLRADIYANGQRTKVYLHRLVLPGHPKVDHWDGNGLNNRRKNLRFATTAQNAWNSRSRGGTSEYKGVCRDKRKNKWVAQITHNGKNLTVLRTDDECLAAAAYDIAAQSLFGDFATSNLGVQMSASVSQLFNFIHPDTGGSDTAMAELNLAREAALREIR